MATSHIQIPLKLCCCLILPPTVVEAHSRLMRLNCAVLNNQEMLGR